MRACSDLITKRHISVHLRTVLVVLTLCRSSYAFRKLKPPSFLGISGVWSVTSTEAKTRPYTSTVKIETGRDASLKGSVSHVLRAMARSERAAEWT